MLFRCKSVLIDQYQPLSWDQNVTESSGRTLFEGKSVFYSNPMSKQALPLCFKLYSWNIEWEWWFQAILAWSITFLLKCKDRWLFKTVYTINDFLAFHVRFDRILCSSSTRITKLEDWSYNLGQGRINQYRFFQISQYSWEDLISCMNRECFSADFTMEFSFLKPVNWWRTSKELTTNRWSYNFGHYCIYLTDWPTTYLTNYLSTWLTNYLTIYPPNLSSIYLTYKLMNLSSYLNNLP
jgi:hypothetical protein